MIPDLGNASWRTSSYSGDNGTCVEVGFASVAVAVRDTKDRAGGMLAVSCDEWASFVTRVKQGAYDPR